MDAEWRRLRCLWFVLESSSGRCQHFDEYFSISRLPLSALAFVLELNPCERDGILAPHLPQVITEVPVTPRPSTLLRKLFTGLANKSQQLRATLLTTKAWWVTERRQRAEGGAAGDKVTRPALAGTALSADMSNEILHIATYSF